VRSSARNAHSLAFLLLLMPVHGAAAQSPADANTGQLVEQLGSKNEQAIKIAAEFDSPMEQARPPAALIEPAARALPKLAPFLDDRDEVLRCVTLEAMEQARASRHPSIAAAAAKAVLEGKMMSGRRQGCPVSRRLVCLAGLAVVAATVLAAQDRPPTGAAPGMAITGRVLDPDGRPVPNVFVTALHDAPVPGRTFSFVSARLRAMTNERGEYRLDGLYAGAFFLIALPHNSPADANGARKRTGFGNTFYPAVASFAEARSVSVRPGISPTADITLLPAPGITGRTSPTGRSTSCRAGTSPGSKS
jgi:Carboxypeptidase regulatory-like domain